VCGCELKWCKLLLCVNIYIYIHIKLHIKSNIYIYIYICVCVCVCVCGLICNEVKIFSKRCYVTQLFLNSRC
jgi:hypothetical protein